MEDKKYNGYKNYETWSIALFIDNEQHLQEEVLAQARELEGYDFAKWLKDFTYDFLGIEDLNIYQQQMLNASLDEVDFRELAILFKENAKEMEAKE